MFNIRLLLFLKYKTIMALSIIVMCTVHETN